MKKNKLILLIIILTISFSSNSQIAYQDLMDSLKSDTYIGMEINLQEVEVIDTREGQKTNALSFYKTNKLNTTDDVLARLSGVSMIKRGNYAWEPSLHGLSGGQINVNIDGMRIFGACTDKMDPVTSYVEPNNMENVLISDGSKGGENGCTVGGTISFETAKPKFDDKLSGNFSTRYESVSQGISELASLNFSKDKLAIRVNAAYRKANNYRNGRGETVLYSQFQKINYAISAAYLLSENSLLSIDYLGDDARNVGYPALPMDVAFAKAKILGLSYDVWNPKPWLHHLQAKVYYNYINHAMDDTEREFVPIHMDMPGNTKTGGAYLNTHMQFGEHRLQAKIDYFSTKAYAEMTMYAEGELPMFMLTWADVKRDDVALFVKDKYQIKQTGIEARARIEFANSNMLSDFGRKQFSVFGYQDGDMTSHTVVYNVGLSVSQQWNEKISTAISLDNGSRLSTVSEQFGFYLYNSNDGFDYLGTPNLANETSTQLALEAKYVSKAIDFRVNVFNYWFKDYIFGKVDASLDEMTIGANGVKVYENIPSATFKGFDVQLLINASAKLQIFLSSKYTHAMDDKQSPLPLIPPLRNNLALVYHFGALKVQAEIERASLQDKISIEAAEKATDSYMISNLRLERQFKFSKSTLNISLGAENMFDTYYRNHLDWGNIMRPGRNVYVSASYSFR